MGDKNLLKAIRSNRKAKFAVLVVVVILVGGVMWFEWYEPSYNGTRLSGWLVEFQNEKVERRLMAAEAVRHIGPRAVPYLVKYLQMDPAKEKSRFSQGRIRFLEWLSVHTPLKISVLRYPSARFQALAALDALGPDAKGALPALEKVLEQYPEEPDIVLGMARAGDAGVPSLQKALTNSAPHDSQTEQLAARVCLNMRATRSFVLYPELAPDPAFSEYLARCTQFHIAMTQTALSDYRAQRPQLNASNVITEPAPTLPLPTPVSAPPAAK